jgi:8-oxo-(d)GTP phosphatase
MPNNKTESRLIKAAGAVAWRPGPGGEPEILLVHRLKYDDWSLPKGKVEPGELLPVTAAREVSEEGGAAVALGRRLVSVRYNVGGRPKRVHYWAARVISMDDHAVPNSEVDLIDWVPATRAVGRVSYAHDHGVLADFTRLPEHTVPLILLRHAKAVGKSDWKRGDASRPLDDSGRADAKSIADLLACFAPRAGFAPGAGFTSRPRLISSPAARCLETLGPLAELTGAQVREEPSLYLHNQSSGTDRADSVPSIAALVHEAIASGEPTVLCAHRENIPDLQAAALAALDFQTPKEWEDSLPPGGFWVLNLATALTPPSSQAAPSAAAAPSAVAPVAPVGAGAVGTGVAGPAVPPSASAARAFSALWRWLRPRDRTSADVPVWLQADGSEGGHEVTEPGESASAVARPAVRLISADRYDLSEP